MSEDGSMRNLFLYGPGGTGKSYLLRKTHKESIAKGVKSVITATTGCAALNVGGCTLHHWSGLKLATEEVPVLYTKITKSKKVLARWLSVEELLIDEVSMLSASFFTKLETLARFIRKNDKPFGGIHLVVSGDFLQLSPVNDDFVFKTDAWKSMNFEIVDCFTPYRYPDEDFFRLLLRARVGQLLPIDIEKLNSRICKSEEDGKVDGIIPTILHSRKVDVGSINEKELAKLEGRMYEYHAVDTKPKYNEVMDEMIPSTVRLKVGAQVMLITNLGVDSGLVNGSRGVVVALETMRAHVRFRHFSIAIDMYAFEKEITEEGRKVTLGRLQIPLILAYALSIHKSQGSTLDSAMIDIGKTIFCSGQAYVCLSRVRSLEGLWIKSFSPDKVYADKEALKFDEESRKEINISLEDD
jgi:ATP-dependent DNA helicase PIF1